MKKIAKIGICLISLCMCHQSAWAQKISIPYIMGFEESDSLELKNWVLNPGDNASKCVDQWMVGTATKNGGRRSLYISDNDMDAEFGAKPNVQYAYRDFTVDAGNYECTFDYRCMGATSSYLSVGISFASNFKKSDMSANYTSGTMSKAVQASLKSETKMLKGSAQWKNGSFSFSVKSTAVYRIFFVWSNANTDTTLSLPVGACIDNIQITTGNCAKPKNLTAVNLLDTVLIEWEGTSEKYIFERRKRGSDYWYTYTELTDKKLILEGMSEGAYDFRVRGVCNDVDTSAYAYLNSFIVYYPENHCIDYFHLNNANIHGTIGTYKNPSLVEDTIVDYGPDDKMSRHTVNTEPDVYDPRTANRLVTIPDGALASVRLGNWNVGAQAETLSFDFVADSTDNAILLIKYAIVMEDPAHQKNEQPRFKLEILDEYGDLIDATCGQADFTADKTRQGWHTVGSGNSAVTWKDWTTMGLNLMDLGLSGQTITIRFTTYDCSMSGHYGYAYFALDCAAAKIYSTSCGNDSVMTVEAPLGFDYKWYNKNGELVSTTKELSVAPSDTTTYRCHLSYVESRDCGFDLYSASRPRYPVAEYTYEWVPNDCQNKVRFHSLSHIMVRFDDFEQHYYDEACDELQWDFGMGKLSPDNDPIVSFPDEGGVFPVTLYASIAEGRCSDDTTMWIKVPAIGDTILYKDSIICQGGYVLWGDKKSDSTFYAAKDGIYSVKWKSMAGCDSTWVLNLKVVPTSTRKEGDTTICAETPLIIAGEKYKYTTSGKFYRFYKNQYACDSTVWWDVTVLDSVQPIVEMNVDMRKHKSGEFIFSGFGYDYYTVYLDGQLYGQYDSSKDKLTGLNGGDFVFDFYNKLGCSATCEKHMPTPCTGLIFQRWGDVLSVMNSDSLGGMEFMAFQWLKDSVAIPGATLSYYYAAGGLDLNADYMVQVTTKDNTTFISCPYRPEPYETKKSEAQKRIEGRQLIIEVNNQKYNAMGMKIE